MFDMTVDCDAFTDKDIRKRCEKRNEVVEKYAEEVAYLNSVLEKNREMLELQKKKAADFTMRKEMPPSDITMRISNLTQQIEIVRSQRHIKESERDIAVTEIDVSAKQGELQNRVKEILKETGKDLSDRAKVQEILKEIRSYHADAGSLLDFGMGRTAVARKSKTEPGIRELLDLEAQGVPLHPDWEKKLQEYRAKKGIKTKDSPTTDDILDLEDMS